MITVHHLENSRSQRILWLLEELELDYELKLYRRDPETMFAPETLSRVHPLGKSPVVVDDDLTIAESGAIIEYLVDTYGQGRTLRPQDKRSRVRYLYWLHFAEGSLMPLLLMRLVFDRMSKPPMPLPLRPVAGLIAAGVKAKFLQPRLAEQLGFVEDELGRFDWFSGEEFSAADVQMSFPLEAGVARGVIDDTYPNIRGFLERIHERPAYRRALEKGGPYEYAD